MKSRHLQDGIDIFGQSWKSRRVCVIGIGRSGMAASRLLAHLGCRVAVSDSRPESVLNDECKALRALGIEDIELGGHTERYFDWAETIVVSPGVSEQASPIRWAAQRQLPVLSEIELAYRFCPAPIVGVTGTNGKSTAVTLITEVLNASRRHAVSCGNVGIPFSSIIEQLTPESVAVVEVSSFQLMTCQHFRPAVGVLLNIGTNHMDRHRDASAYLAAKTRLFKRQTHDDWAVLNGRDPRIVELADKLSAQRVWFGENRSNKPNLQLAPETLHMLSDGAQAVLQVGRLLGVADPLTWQVIRAFRGLEHRLEPVATIDGVHFINDSKSTTPESLLYALQRTPGMVIPILGGRDKGMNFESLRNPLSEGRIKAVVLIGESRSRLRALFSADSAVYECASLEEAVSVAAKQATIGATVLFSPACASFDMFRDFEHRGRVFKSIVGQMIEGQPAQAAAPAGNAKSALIKVQA